MACVQGGKENFQTWNFMEKVMKHAPLKLNEKCRNPIKLKGE